MMTIRSILKKYGVKKQVSVSTHTYRKYYKSSNYSVLRVVLKYKKGKCVDATWTLWLRRPDGEITNDIIFDLNYIRVVGVNCVNDIKAAIIYREEVRQ